MMNATTSAWLQTRPGINAMTFRVYLRWPGQRVTDKTTTDSRAVADLAFRELAEKSSQLADQGALGVSYTEDGKQINYVRFAEEEGEPRGRSRQ